MIRSGRFVTIPGIMQTQVRAPASAVPLPLVTNGSFDSDATGWAAWGAVLASVAGGYVGNGLEVKNNDGVQGRGYQAVPVTPGATYVFEGYLKNGTASSYFQIGNSLGGIDYLNTGGGASWGRKTKTFQPTTSPIYIQCVVNSYDVNQTSYFDQISLVKL